MEHEGSPWKGEAEVSSDCYKVEVVLGIICLAMGKGILK
jgi:hypothetical protein